MVRIAGERISELFALAESEAVHSHPELANRYVALARRIGMRYNVRLLREYRELYCRSCSAFWIEGRNVRTRLRAGRRVRTCLGCGRERRTPVRLSPTSRTRGASTGPDSARQDEASVAEVELEAPDDSREDGEGEEE